MKKILKFKKKDVLLFFDVFSKIHQKTKEKKMLFVIHKKKFRLIIKKNTEIVRSKIFKNSAKLEYNMFFLIEYNNFFNIIKTIKVNNISIYSVKKNIICLKKKKIFYYMNIIKKKCKKNNIKKNNNNCININSFLLKKQIINNLFVLKNKQSSFINGLIFISKKNMIKTISSDNFRMSYSKFESKNYKKENKFFIKKIIIEILLIIINQYKNINFNIKVYVFKKNINFNIKGINIYTKIFKENVFDYKSISSLKYNKGFLIKKKPLLESLRRSGLLNTNNVFHTTLKFKKKYLEIKSNNFEKEIFIENIKILNLEKKKLKICVNTNFLKEPLNVIEEKKILIKFNKKKKVILIRPQMDKNFKHFLMPIEN